MIATIVVGAQFARMSSGSLHSGVEVDNVVENRASFSANHLLFA